MGRSYLCEVAFCEINFLIKNLILSQCLNSLSLKTALYSILFNQDSYRYEPWLDNIEYKTDFAFLKTLKVLEFY